MLSMRPDEVKTESKSARPQVEPGTYPVRLTLLIDLGIQAVEDFDDRTIIKKEHQLWLGFSFPTERYDVELEDGETVVREQSLGRAMKVSNHEKANLQKYFEILCKRGETYADMLGRECLAQVGVTSGGKAKLTGISKLMKGMVLDTPLFPDTLITEEDYDSIGDMDVFIPPFLVEAVKNRVQS